MNLRRTKTHMVLWGGVALATSVAACSDDDAGARATVTTDAAVAEVASNPDDPYCDLEREIDSFFESAFGGLGPDATEDEQRAAVQTASQGVVDAGLTEEALAIAPEILRDALETLSSNVRAAAQGDVDVFFTPESDAAGARVDAYCGLSD